MVKSRVKEIILVSVLVMIFSLMSSVVLATDSPIQIPSANTTTEENTVEEIDPNTTAPVNTTTETNTITTIPTTNNTTTTLTTNRTEDTALPKTGETSDYVVMALIAVATVSAAYAYTKSKKYNV